AHPRAADRPHRPRRPLPVPELRPREPVDELRTAGLPRPARDLDAHLPLRARRPDVGDRRRDSQARRPGLALPRAVNQPAEGVAAIAPPQGKVPQGMRATTVFELVSITASSLARPTVA